MSRRNPKHEFVENLSTETLDAREALYLRLLNVPAIRNSAIGESLHLKLCQVRAEQFAR